MVWLSHHGFDLVLLGCICVNQVRSLKHMMGEEKWEKTRAISTPTRPPPKKQTNLFNFSGITANVYRNSTLASWASDNEGEESVCRRIRVHILKVLTWYLIGKHWEIRAQTNSPPHLWPIPQSFHLDLQTKLAPLLSTQSAWHNGGNTRAAI